MSDIKVIKMTVAQYKPKKSPYTPRKTPKLPAPKTRDPKSNPYDASGKTHKR